MQIVGETKIKNTKKHERLELICECCGEKVDRWDMDVVLPVEDSILPSSDFTYACPVCVTNKDLTPAQSEYANKFRNTNEELRKALSDIPIH